MTPFPEYPILHVQMKLSSVLTHCELLLQLSKPREHSSISKSKIIKKYIRITRETKVYAGTGSNNISKDKKNTRMQLSLPFVCNGDKVAISVSDCSANTGIDYAWEIHIDNITSAVPRKGALMRLPPKTLTFFSFGMDYARDPAEIT